MAWTRSSWASRCPRRLVWSVTAGTTVALIPAYLAIRSTHDRSLALRFAGYVLTWVALAGLLAWLALTMLAEEIVAITGSGLTNAGQAEAVGYLRLVAPSVFVYSVYGIVVGVCQAEERFAPMAAVYRRHRGGGRGGDAAAVESVGADCLRCWQLGRADRRPACVGDSYWPGIRSSLGPECAHPARACVPYAGQALPLIDQCVDPPVQFDDRHGGRVKARRGIRRLAAVRAPLGRGPDRSHRLGLE